MDGLERKSKTQASGDPCESSAARECVPPVIDLYELAEREDIDWSAVGQRVLRLLSVQELDAATV